MINLTNCVSYQLVAPKEIYHNITLFILIHYDDSSIKVHYNNLIKANTLRILISFIFTPILVIFHGIQFLFNIVFKTSYLLIYFYIFLTLLLNLLLVVQRSGTPIEL